jgi:hypothetical protein
VKQRNGCRQFSLVVTDHLAQVMHADLARLAINKSADQLVDGGLVSRHGYWAGRFHDAVSGEPLRGQVEP